MNPFTELLASVKTLIFNSSGGVQAEGKDRTWGHKGQQERAVAKRRKRSQMRRALQKTRRQRGQNVRTGTRGRK